MSLLLHGDCLEHLHSVDDNSVDLIFCDLPYGQTSCSWDCKIDLTKLWEHFMRIKKLHTPLFFTTTTKFGCDLIQSAPKKCFFRYDLVWVKSAATGFLSAKRAPMRKHEMVYVFYEKLPLYDLSSHQHKFIKERDAGQKNGSVYGGEEGKKLMEGKYDPPLPTSVFHGEIKKEGQIYNGGKPMKVVSDGQGPQYDPPLPTTMLEIKSTRGKHSTEKPVALMSWILKYYSKEGDVVLDPTMGSGSTGVACKEMNRNFIGIEMDPEIYEVAVNRINN